MVRRKEEISFRWCHGAVGRRTTLVVTTRASHAKRAVISRAASGGCFLDVSALEVLRYFEGSQLIFDAVDVVLCLKFVIVISLISNANGKNPSYVISVWNCRVR